MKRRRGGFGYRPRSNDVLKQANVDYVTSCKLVPCFDCGTSYPPYVMDFDHLPGRKKSFTISQFLRMHGGEPNARALLEEEISKCQCVCSNCHRERTHARSAGRIFMGKAGSRPGPPLRLLEDEEEDDDEDSEA